MSQVSPNTAVSRPVPSRSPISEFVTLIHERLSIPPQAIYKAHSWTTNGMNSLQSWQFLVVIPETVDASIYQDRIRSIAGEVELACGGSLSVLVRSRSAVHDSRDPLVQYLREEGDSLY